MVYTDPKARTIQAIIGAVLWALSCVTSFFTFNATLSLIRRLYSYFWLREGVFHTVRGSISVQQFALIPLGMFFLAGVIIGGDLIIKYAGARGEYIWKFYSIFLGIQFAILFLAAQI